MEGKNIVKNKEVTSSSSKFPLNYDCMYELFKRLDGIDACMNLAESCDELQTIADWTFKTKFNKVTIDFGTLVDIDRLLYHVGPFVQSLTLKLFNKSRYTDGDLAKIRKACVELKSLTIIGFERNQFNEYPFGGACDDYKLESLTLAHCKFAYDEDIFKNITTLKSLNMVCCLGVSNNAMKKCFTNNQEINSYVCAAGSMPSFELLQLLPNLERLGWCKQDSKTFDPSILSKLKSLRSLLLHCNNENVNNVLTELGTRKDIQELELTKVVVDENTFELVKSLNKLRRLRITTSRKYVFTSSNEFPSSLETLKLDGFHLSERRVISLITTQESLGNINLANCVLSTKREFSSMADLIVQKCNVGQRKVSLTLNKFGELSTKVSKFGAFVKTQLNALLI